MPPDLSSFRRDGHALVDFIAEYLEGIERWPVLAQVRPGEVRAALPASPPAQPESFDQVLDDVRRSILPGLTHWQHPSFFAYFPANASPPAILGELLSAGLGVQGMLWATSPACTELETHMLDWLVEMLGLPARFRSDGSGGGVIQDTASSSTLCALLAARDRATEWRSNEAGIDRRFTAYTSNQAHSSVEKAMAIAGLGRESLRLIEVDEHFAMRPEALEAAITSDRAAGHTPVFCCATVGTTSSGAMDPLRPIGEVCARHGLWLHVDAAWAGAAAVCPEFRPMHDGLELAESYAFNPHKWMLVNFDCDAFWIADRAALVRTLSVLPEYLRNHATESGKVIDYRDWHIPLGRRFRALKLWFTIRHYGAEGIKAKIRDDVAMATWFAEQVRSDPRFELAAPPSLGLVCFRLCGDGEDSTAADASNLDLMERLNASGRLYLTHTRLDGRVALRLAVGGTWTRWEHVQEAWEMVNAPIP